MCVICTNHIFSNVIITEQDIRYAFKVTEEETPQGDTFIDTNRNTRFREELYTDLNNNDRKKLL